MSLGSRLTPAVTWIIGISVGVFLVWLFAGKDVQAQLVRWLQLTPASLLEGHVWKLVTTSLLNPDGLSFFINVLMLWLFVPVLEREWGTRRFVWFAVATLLVANVVSAAVGLAAGPTQPIGGLSALIYASIAAFGTAFGRQPIQFFGVLPMRGRTFAIGILFFLMLSLALTGRWIEGAGYLAAMGVAWGFAGGRLTPSVWLLRWRRSRLRKKISVLDGGSGKRPGKHDWLN